MTMSEINVTGHSFDEIADAFETLARRNEDLTPLGYRVRSRWLESERRVFARGAFAPRAGSTTRRYRYPVRHSGDEQLHTDKGGRPMHFTGMLERGLTTAQARGQRDTSRPRPGGLDVTVGIKPNGPLFYGAINQRGAGARPARKVVVFDAEAHGDSAGDYLEYVLSR
jgi:hypothetical protein